MVCPPLNANIDFKAPWVPVGQNAAGLVQELEREVAENHPLWNKKVRAIAQRIDTDDVLFALGVEGGHSQYVVVHLTWSGEPEPAPRWPDAEQYNSLEDWARERMMPDHAKFTS